MGENVSIAIALLSVGLLLFVLGRMRLVGDRFYVPLFLSSFIFAGFYAIKIFHDSVVPLLGFSAETNNLLFNDYGIGLLGLLPLALSMLLIGKYLVKMKYTEQWGGTVQFKLPSLLYGTTAGLLIVAIPLLIALSKGYDFNPKVSAYMYGVNCVTNLYEEVIFRGLLLACCVRYWSRIAAVVWTSAVFGLAHGLNEKSILIALGAGLMAWAVLKAKSLWAGWTTHQLADMIVDTFLP